MAHENKILHLSIFVGLFGFLVGGVADAAVRIGNKTKNDVYRQIVAANAAAANNAATATTAETELPVTVANPDLAQQIQDGTSNINKEQLESCAKIYPNGTFAWDKPTAGIGAGGASTCVAVVELRGYQMGPGGKDVVLARANVAAGSGVKCNISDFPEADYTVDAQNVLFPADAEPTTEDVIKVLNEEQKQHAALKIAAGALVGGIGGNIAGKNDVGKDSLMGTDKGKMKGTLIGALGGAAITAGGSYAGKVGGDMILSSGINAAAGGIVGNMMGSGDSVLRIEDCADESGTQTAKCLWGYVSEGTNMVANSNGEICNSSNNCEEAFFDLVDRSYMVCKDHSCRQESFALAKIEFDGKPVEVNSLKEADFDKLKEGLAGTVYLLEKQQDGTYEITSTRGLSSETSHPYARIVSAIANPSRKAALVWGVQDKFFGIKRSDWYEWKKTNGNAQVYRRDSKGNKTGAELTGMLNNFEPMVVDADDGGIIDLNNKARLKGTMIGAGAGGALGAFVAYQGAQNDIDERWVAAVREYKDSLQKFYCATGARFLSYYNDTLIIPNAEQ